MGNSVFAWLAIGLMSLACLTLGWALMADLVVQRVRKRRRCPRCWYDLSHTPSLTCSECGYKAARDRTLFKARRRWRVVLFLALPMLLGAYALKVAPRVKDRGWIAAFPNTYLVFFAPVEASAWETREWDGRIYPIRPTNPILVELLQRCDDRTLTGWQWRVYLRRFFETYPSDLSITTRDAWPADVPIRLTVRCERAIASARDMLFRYRIAGGDEWQYVTPGRMLRPPVAQQIPPAGATDVTFEVEILLGVDFQWDSNNQGRANLDDAYVVWHERTPPIPIRGSVDEHMTAHPSALGEAAVRRLHPGLVRREDGRIQFTIRHANFHFDSSDCALGLRVELLCGDKVIATGEAELGIPSPGTHVSYMDGWSGIDLNWLQPPSDCRQDTTLRLTGDPAVALRDFWRSSYWDGTVEVPVSLESIETREPHLIHDIEIGQ